MRWTAATGPTHTGSELWELDTSYLERIEAMIVQRIREIGPHGPKFPKSTRRIRFQLLAIRRELMYRGRKEYNAFRLAILKDPKDITNKLVFADWLQEEAPGIYNRPMAVLERKMRMYTQEGRYRPFRKSLRSGVRNDRVRGSNRRTNSSTPASPHWFQDLNS